MGAVVVAHWLVYHDQPIELHSGALSHWFVDGDVIFNDLELRTEVLRSWQASLDAAGYLDFPDSRGPLYFTGIASGGIRWAKAIAEVIRGGVYVEEEPHAKPLVVVDDVMTTGESFKPYGLTPRLVVVDRRKPERRREHYLTGYWATLDLDTWEEE